MASACVSAADPDLRPPKPPAPVHDATEKYNCANKQGSRPRPSPSALCALRRTARNAGLETPVR
jgi:hypothetical protein